MQGPAFQAQVAAGATDNSAHDGLDVILPDENGTADPEPVLSAAGRPVRPRVLPRRYQQLIPDPLPPPPPPSPPELETSRSGMASDASGQAPESMEAEHSPDARRAEGPVRTEPNQFGLFRVYYGRGPTEPNEINRETERFISDALPEEDDNPDTASNTYAPYPNESSYRLGSWFWNGNERKSKADFMALVKLLTSPQFHARDLESTNWTRVDQELADSSETSSFDSRDGWISTTVKINVPFGMGANGPKPQRFQINDFWYRRPLDVIRNVFESPRAKDFCYTPYELRVKPPAGGSESNVYGEMYWSKAFRDAHAEVQHLPREPGDTLPRAVAAMMFWSDGMAVTNFGNAKLWPAYMQFGNESKYVRTRASSGACHHIAFLPSVGSPIFRSSFQL